MKRMKKAAGASLVLLMLTACGGIDYPYVNVRMYNLVNIHPDEKSQVIFSINYQREGLIPLCTPVTILGVDDEKARIRDENTGRVYTYVFHTKYMRTTIPEHLDKYFGTECNQAAMEQLNQMDEQGIKLGRAMPGMTRNGVLLAIGYPPEHETPDLSGHMWKYWSSRFATFVVVFNEQGTVVQVR